MLRKKTIKSLPYLLGALLIFALAGCGAGSAAAPTPTPPPPPPTPTPVPTPTSAPTAPTLTPEPESPEAAGMRTFQIVPAESRASYIVDEEFFADALAKYGIEVGRVDTVGSTQNIEGQLQIDLNDLSAPLGTNRFTVNIATLASNQSRRDNWIRENGPKLNSFPIAEFVATGVEETPATYSEGNEVQFKMMGDLTIREVTQPVTFDVTAKLEGDTATGVATARLQLTDFGIEPPSFANTLTVANEFMVRVEFTAREQ